MLHITEERLRMVRVPTRLPNKFMTNQRIELLKSWQATVIKGNAAELGALANSQEVRPEKTIRTCSMLLILPSDLGASERCR